MSHTKDTEKSLHSDELQKEMLKNRRTVVDLGQPQHPRKTQKKATFLANIKPLKVFSQDGEQYESAVHFALSESLKGRELFKSILREQRNKSQVKITSQSSMGQD
jgi:hypothetical protein